MDQRVAIVTGASKGIGLEITNTLLGRGYRVVATARNASTQRALEPTERLLTIDGDIGDPATAERLLDGALTRFGRLDLLVNNAGIFISKPFTEYSPEDYARLVSTNMNGFYCMTQRALVEFARAGSGHIVSIGTSLVAQPLAAVPSALPIFIKAGIQATTRALAIEYASRRIRVNAIAPGIIDTPMHTRENHPFLATLSPAQRIGTPAEVAQALLYLESAAFVSGQVLHLDGGAHAGKWS